MITETRLHWMQRRLNDRAGAPPAWWDYIRKHEIELADVLPHCGNTLVLDLCKAIETIDGQYVFDLDDDGVACVVVEGLRVENINGLNEYVCRDLIAWPLDAPDHWATAMGPGRGISLLGPTAAFRMPSDKTPIRLHRNPETWLLSGCLGSVILKPEAESWLSKSDVAMICEDAEHARSVKHLLGNKGRAREFFIPEHRTAA